MAQDRNEKGGVGGPYMIQDHDHMGDLWDRQQGGGQAGMSRQSQQSQSGGGQQGGQSPDSGQQQGYGLRGRKPRLL